jgi:hypothetical protein
VAGEERQRPDHLFRQQNMLRESTMDSLYATRPDMPEVSS